MASFFQKFTSASASASNADIATPDGILAFRSITRLISVIQQAPFNSDKLPDRELAVQEGRQELTLSVAFSILATLEHEVVAVMGKEGPSGLEVIVCSNIPYHGDQTLIRQLADKIFPDMLFSRNDRAEEPPVGGRRTSYPQIIPISLPDNLKEGSITTKELRQYIKGLCNDQPNSKEPRLLFPLPQHLGVLRQLLISGSEAVRSAINNEEHDEVMSQVAKDMLAYVIATSYVKMNKRIQKSGSKAYFNALTTAPVEKLGSVLSSTSGERDKDGPFLLYLAQISNDWRKKFPLLYDLGTRAHTAWISLSAPKKGWSISFHLYTAETRKEFHELFVMCLKQLEEGFRKLVNIRRPKSNEKRESFLLYVNSIILHGDCLRKLVRTHALQQHLHAVLYLRHAEPSLVSTPTPTLHGRLTDPEEENEVEPLLTDVITIPLVQPYRDWLKRIIAEFDAADILLSHFVKERQSTPISMSVVTPPPTNTTALPWKNLFLSSYLPEGIITNKELFQFLINVESALSEASIFLVKFRNYWGTRSVTKMIDVIKTWKTVHAKAIQMIERKESVPWQSWMQAHKFLMPMPIWLSMLNELDLALSKWKPDRSPTLEAEIEGSLAFLEKSTGFFSRVVKTNDSEQFSGRVHCEACLASLIAAFATGDGPADEDGHLCAMIKRLAGVIGVSKQCCPACSSLLKHVSDLLIDRKRGFITRGSHNTVSACSLPAWLPKNIVAQMNHDLGDMLRSELIELAKVPELWRKRTSSTGSSGRSSSSSEYDGHQIMIRHSPEGQ